MKYIIFIIILIAILNECRQEEAPPFKSLSTAEIEALSPGDKSCYKIAEKINLMISESPTHCTLIKEEKSSMFNENYSYYLQTSINDKNAWEWHVWGCLSAGSVMNDGAGVGMIKLYFKSNPSRDFASVIDAYSCRDIQRKAYNDRPGENWVLKEFNRRSRVEKYQ